MALDLFPLFPRSIRAKNFERSVFSVVLNNITDKHAFSDEIARIEKLNALPSTSEQRQKMAAELYLRFERNIAEEQTRNRVPPEKLREEIYQRCHPQIAEGNFALLFLPRYEQQIAVSERFTNMALAKAWGLLGIDTYSELLKYVGDFDPLMQGCVKDKGIDWGKLRRRLKKYTPAVQRETIQALQTRIFRIITSYILKQNGEIRTELIYKELYQEFQNTMGFIEDASKVLLLVPSEFLNDERVTLMEKSELAQQLRAKNQAIEVALAEIQGERLKLSELTREELEKKVQQRTAELVNALQTAQSARKNLEEFSSLATHELRTPIAAVKGYLNLILTGIAGAVTDEQKKYLQSMDHANEHLLTLVNAMLDVSRIELGTLAVSPAPVQLAQASDAVLTELAAKIKEKEMVVVKNYDATMPTINLDPELMHAIFINLISNAIKYTPEKGLITIGIEKRADDALITVADTGLGIPAAQQEHIFEKMFRADNARVNVAEGTGLGLYLVRSILIQTGGTISFTSEEGKGTTFSVAIPLSGMKAREGVRGLS